jgi:O-6-methylguanine DNA methyltransferase
MSETFHTAEFDSPIGPLKIASSSRGLAYLELSRASGRGFHGWRERYAPDSRVEPGFEPNQQVVKEVLEYLEGKRREFDLLLDLRGTPFQEKVYGEVRAIPYGECRSYSQIADRIDRPAAVRAVGAANGANPLPLVIPCHRVIGSNGQLHGYAGGRDVKARLLAIERSAPGDGWLL